MLRKQQGGGGGGGRHSHAPHERAQVLPGCQHGALRQEGCPACQHGRDNKCIIITNIARTRRGAGWKARQRWRRSEPPSTARALGHCTTIRRGTAPRNQPTKRSMLQCSDDVEPMRTAVQKSQPQPQ